MSQLAIHHRAFEPEISAATATRFRWIQALCLLLLGYALAGKGFGYLGYPPVFIGELVLLAGLIVLLNGRRWCAVFRSPVALLLLPLLIWGAARTVPFINQYGIMALRDAVIWGYSLWAILVAGLLISTPEFLDYLLKQYRRFVLIFLFCIPLLGAVQLALGDSVPRLPFSDVPIFHVKGGDALVHCAGIAAFMIAGLGEDLHPAWMLLLPISVIMFGSVNRGGLLAFAVAIMAAVALRPRNGFSGKFFAAAVLLAGILWAANLQIEVPGTSRVISIDQIGQNVTSIAARKKIDPQDTTVAWRLAWWNDIFAYTFHGPYFWTGKGFGVNLADDDGYQVTADDSLRSPHSGHFNILARAGVPGLAIWLLLNLAWAAAIFRRYLQCSSPDQRRWRGIFIFLLVYWLAFMCDAAFDVFIEGPMGGIWFWSIFGAGLAAMWIHDRQPQLLPDHANPGGA